MGKQRLPKKPYIWLMALFEDGRSFKIPCEYIIQQACKHFPDEFAATEAESSDMQQLAALYNKERIIELANKLSWSQVIGNAFLHGGRLTGTVSDPYESWKTAVKSCDKEPNPRPT